MKVKLMLILWLLLMVFSISPSVQQPVEGKASTTTSNAPSSSYIPITSPAIGLTNDEIAKVNQFRQNVFGPQYTGPWQIQRIVRGNVVEGVGLVHTLQVDSKGNVVKAWEQIITSWEIAAIGEIAYAIRASDEPPTAGDEAIIGAKIRTGPAEVEAMGSIEFSQNDQTNFGWSVGAGPAGTSVSVNTEGWVGIGALGIGAEVAGVIHTTEPRRIDPNSVIDKALMEIILAMCTSPTHPQETDIAKLAGTRSDFTEHPELSYGKYIFTEPNNKGLSNPSSEYTQKKVEIPSSIAQETDMAKVGGTRSDFAQTPKYLSDELSIKPNKIEPMGDLNGNSQICPCWKSKKPYEITMTSVGCRSPNIDAPLTLSEGYTFHLISVDNSDICNCYNSVTGITVCPCDNEHHCGKGLFELRKYGTAVDSKTVSSCGIYTYKKGLGYIEIKFGPIFRADEVAPGCNIATISSTCQLSEVTGTCLLPPYSEYYGGSFIKP